MYGFRFSWGLWRLEVALAWRVSRVRQLAAGHPARVLVDDVRRMARRSAPVDLVLAAGALVVALSPLAGCL